MKIGVIIASIRPASITERVAQWVNAEMQNLEDIEPVIIDLKGYKLPLFDESASPQYNPERQPEGEVKEWLDKLDEMDAFVIVSPEYNRSMPGAMKNALDYIDFQFSRKPVALVTHGSVGGAYALGNYRIALAQLLAVTVPESTMITNASQIINETGELEAGARANPWGPRGALQKTLHSLKWYGEALASARTEEVVYA